MVNPVKTVFVPTLFIGKGIKDISFYTYAFGAVELRRWCNNDGSIHVVELAIDGAMFHLHEENVSVGSLSPLNCNGVTAVTGLMVADVDAVMAAALKAGATEISAVKDYDYGYRQGEIKDPFGHRWLIEKRD